MKFKAALTYRFSVTIYRPDSTFLQSTPFANQTILFLCKKYL